MIIRNQSASSASGNKVYIPQGDYTCPTANCIVELVCDGQGSPSQWIMKGAN
jgi:hypothetical protein